MAMTSCKECRARISSTAKACPQCGAPAPKKTGALTWVAGFFVVVIAVKMVASSVESSDRPAPPAKTPAQIAADQAKEREFQTVAAGARWLKDSMKKPESFELVSATMVGGDTVCYEYKARNSFNDQRRETYVIATAVSSKSVDAWNKHCAGKAGTDYSYVRAALR